MRQNKTNGNPGLWKKMLASMLVFALIGVSPSVFAGSEPSDDQLCADRLREARAYIEEHRDSLTSADAILYLNDLAGDVCDFENAPAPQSASAQDSRPLTLDDAGTWTTEEVVAYTCDVATCDEGLELLVDGGSKSEVVQCLVGGSGAGTIKTTVLGVELIDEIGAGQWEPANDGRAVEVTGEGELTGGTQLNNLGDIRVLKAAQIPANDGETSATCLQTIKTESEVSRRCFLVWIGFIIFVYCEEKVTTTTEITIEPCTGSATQSLVLGAAGPIETDTYQSQTTVITTQHDYETDPNPCEAATAALAAFDGADVSG